MKTFTKLSFVALAAMGLALAGCDKDNPTKPSLAGVFEGEQKAVGNGNVRSWVSLDDQGNPNAIGVTFTETALSNLPGNPLSTELALPQQASATPFNHLTFDWLSQGHDPAPIYGKPHFDAHFYMISRQERNAITPGPDMTPVESKYVPKDYVSGVFAVPRMGVHWSESTAHEFHGQAFDMTCSYGFYKGNMVFIEPMLDKAFLETKQNVAAAIKQPAAFQRTGLYYPTSCSIKYDAGKKEYSFALVGLTLR
jgi:hypothetical protein